ncbi:hypothetical protein PAMP_001163 [Pampus punctatissimus]
MSVMQMRSTGLAYWPNEARTDEDKEVKLGKYKEDELEKSMEEWVARLDEVRKAVQSNLWQRDGYELLLEVVRRLIHDASASLKDCERWIPPDQIAHLEGRSQSGYQYFRVIVGP